MSDHIAIKNDEYKEIMEELEYLRYFFCEADFGPAHEDVVSIINEGYSDQIPEGY